jgi:hypothetical protein
VTPLLEECVDDHFVNCPSTEPRPLIYRKDYYIMDVRGDPNPEKPPKEKLVGWEP